jgi:hypothetical protein
LPFAAFSTRGTLGVEGARDPSIEKATPDEARA